MQRFKTATVLLLNLLAVGTLVYSSGFSGCCCEAPKTESFRLETTQKHLFPIR